MAKGYDVLTPEGKRFYAELANLKELQVYIGFQAGEVTDDKGVDIAQIAMFNELGTSTSPSRPFIRNTVDENRDKIDAMGQAQANALTKGGTAESALKTMGAFGVSLMQKTIGGGGFEPNAPSTIKKKGSDTPLIDTGRMRQSVKYIIQKKGEE